MAVRSTAPTFEETQVFDQIWIKLLVWGIPIILVTSMVVSVWLGSEDFRTSLPGLTIGLIISGTVALLFMFLRLTVTVDSLGIHIRFVPFVRQNIAFADLESAKARTYRPIREYGGWGIRFGVHGKAYNVKRNEGVQLVFKNGKRLLIGSQKAAELEQAIASHLDHAAG